MPKAAAATPPFTGFPRDAMQFWHELASEMSRDWFPSIPRGMLHQARLADWLVEHGKAMAPLVGWLHRHVG